MTLATVVTWNLVFKGVIGGLITALVAMGIVLVYRSSRVINFAVGSIGLPGHRVVRGDGRRARLAVLALAVRLAGRRHAHRRAHRARGDPPPVQGAAGHRARRHHRGRAAVRGDHPVAPRVPHGHAADAVPGAVQRHVVPRARHRGLRQPAARPHRRAGHHRRALVDPRAHRVRRRGARVRRRTPTSPA